MRIGVVSTPWVPVPPPAYGGLEAVVDRLVRGFVTAGHEVLLAAPANSACEVPLVPGLGEVDTDASVVGHASNEMYHAATAYAAMAEVDVIHDHTVTGALYRYRPVGVRVVATNHGTFDTALNTLYAAMSRDTAVVAISHHQASTAAGVDIARVIHHGLDVDDVPLGTGDGGYAAFLGRMSPIKGAREAIQVAREAGVPLRLAAKMREQAEMDYFHDEVEPLLGGDIEYVGEVDEQGKYELLGGAVAMLNPIQWDEPFGLVMIEALACGTPVVTTSSGSVPEIIDDGRTGFLRDHLDDLAVVLRDAADLDRAACREVAETRFSTRRMVEGHIALYADLVEHPGS